MRIWKENRRKIDRKERERNIKMIIERTSKTGKEENRIYIEKAGEIKRNSKDNKVKEGRKYKIRERGYFILNEKKENIEN